MGKWLMFLLLLAVMMFPASAHAQSEIKLDTMNIELWSEYDQPTMLVINEFVLSPEIPLPAAVTLRFPKEGNLFAVAVESDGELMNKVFSGPAEQGDWQAITINVESYDPHRLEYYQPLTRDGNKRQFKYQWFGDYSVKNFAVTILVPADSTELMTSPELQTTTPALNGTAISATVSKNELKMGNSFQFEAEYQRASDALIYQGQSDEIQPEQAVGPDTPGRVSITNLPLVIGAFGLALIGIALFSYWRSTKTSETKPRRRRPHAQEAEDGQAYCHECGARAHAGDRFCRTCGSRIRTE
jgi:hypothetical protein